MNEEKEYVLVSLCLLGVPCRYHGLEYRMGKHIGRPKLVERLRKKNSILPLCPEIMGGLPTPRPPAKVIYDSDGNMQVVTRDGKTDVTKEYVRGTKAVLEICERFNVKKAYLLKGSPACGKEGTLGLALAKRGIKVVSV